MSTGTPVLDTLVDITTASIEHNSVSPRDFMLARLAALIAVDAPPASYLANAAAVERAGLTSADIEGVMIAVAPVVGTPRVVAAAGHILRVWRQLAAKAHKPSGAISNLQRSVMSILQLGCHIRTATVMAGWSAPNAFGSDLPLATSRT